MITSVQALDAANAAMRAECKSAADRLLATARRQVIHVQLHIEGRDWYECRGSQLQHTNLGERTSDVDALFAVKAAHPQCEVTISRAVFGGIDATLF